jgi:tyrosyl-tRNA synthetase
MSMAHVDVFSVLKERGFLAQVTHEDEVRAAFSAGPVTVYTGYDPTADSLHVGHLVTLMALMHLERAGHRPIVILGGGTAMIGDPSGRTELRQMLTAEQIGANVEQIRGQIGRLLDVKGGTTRVLNNADWLRSLNYIAFLRDIGRHFSVNRMLTAEAYKSRLAGNGLSFIEFNYQLLQSYDFLVLAQKYGCTMQFGGDDQWGNIVAGVDLVRRVESKQVHGMTYPLLTTATGAKMGKTAAGAMWLSADKLAPYDYYQYWVNCDDADVARFLAIFTLLPMAEIAAVATLRDADINHAKSILAFEASAIVHGVDVAREVHSAAQGAFGGRAIPGDVLPSSTVPRQSEADASVIPSTALARAALESGVPLVDVLVTTGLASSKGEARRLLTQGGVRLGDTKVDDAQHKLTTADLADGAVLIRAGKKRVHRVTVG